MWHYNRRRQTHRKLGLSYKVWEKALWIIFHSLLSTITSRHILFSNIYRHPFSTKTYIKKRPSLLQIIMDSFSKQPAMALDLANKRMQSKIADQETPTVRMVVDNPSQCKTVRFADYPETHEIPAEMATWQESEKAECPTLQDQLQSESLTRQAFREIAEQEARDNAIVFDISTKFNCARPGLCASCSTFDTAETTSAQHAPSNHPVSWVAKRGA